MRIVFMGTGDIALPTLDFLFSSPDHDLVGVVTQPDKPVGRKQLLTAPEVKTRALKAGVPVHQPERIRRESALAPLREWAPEVIVVMAYGQILPKALLHLPTIACLNLHASLLPRHRGAAPVQAAIRDGDSHSGITVMFIDEGLDTGDILLQEAFELNPEETGQSLHDRLALCAPIALERALDLLATGNSTREPQDSALATHTGKLTREHGAIDWSKPAVEIERLIRAFDPWPGTHCELNLTSTNRRKLKIYPPVSVIPELKGAPGHILKAETDRLIIGTGDGALALHEVQLDGGKRMTVRAFLAGHPIEIA